ncbi:MAG: ATP-dependent helicase HrpB [Deltaproteobacteria bacterium]|nr:ATP-dependent helicase HrpB [Deltaproteobacteria bacterium]
MERIPLPVDEVLPEVASALRARGAAVVQAPPGSGKTTRVPPAVLAGADGDVVVLEPRRIAARVAARRVAEEAGEPVGRSVGYRVRFEECGGRATRLWFVTEGVLVRRLASDPDLRGVAAVVLDEFHERSLDADLAVALLRRLRRTTRPDLRLVAMSATLDAAGVAGFLDAAVVVAEGRRFDVEVEHLARPDDRPLAIQVASAVERAALKGPPGDCLVFLPGAAEIRQARDACEEAARRHGLLLVALHGDLPAAEQDRAVAPSDRPRLILSTNVAETSVTIDGVTTVIDTGLARQAAHSPWSGLKTLRVVRASRASIAQRAGRAGRTRPGRCLRLFTRADADGRPERDPPEVVRSDLAETVLLVRGMGLDPAAIEWLDAPPRQAIPAAEALLSRLGALDDSGGLSAAGRAMLRIPVHPRLARIVVEAAAGGLAEDGCMLAAVLAERDVRRSARSVGLGAGGSEAAGESLSPHGFLDPIEAVDVLADLRATPRADHELRRLGLDPPSVAAVLRARDQILKTAREAVHATRTPRHGPSVPPDRRAALTKALLAGFPDRVGRTRAAARGRPGASEFALAAGGVADLPGGALLPEGRLLVVADAAERQGTHGAALLVRAAAVVEEDWLLDLFLDQVREVSELRFNTSAGRVEAVRRVLFDGLVLEETPDPAPDAEAVAALLADAARKRGIDALASEGEDPGLLLARVAFLRTHRPDLGLPAFDPGQVGGVIAGLCRGRRSLAEVRAAGVVAALEAVLTREQRRALAELAPPSIALPGGRRLRLEYEEGRPPSAGSRLQDFFGMARGPAVLGGEIPVVLHLRSPAGRDVQVTTDLAGFWERHYPALARELRRRYPRHTWPDDPANARPPAPGRTR